MRVCICVCVCVCGNLWVCVLILIPSCISIFTMLLYDIFYLFNSFYDGEICISVKINVEMLFQYVNTC